MVPPVVVSAPVSPGPVVNDENTQALVGRIMDTIARDVTVGNIY